MKEKKYIMIGSPIISKEIFRNVLRPLNNYNFEITGGFWSSEYINDSYNISDWFIYLIKISEIAKYKNINVCSIFTLKENAKILTIDNPNIVYELAQKYPSYHHTLNYCDENLTKEIIFDFEMLSKEYDGIYVNKKNLTTNINYTIFNNWVNSLLLFNLDCIKEYQTARIVYDIDNPYSIPYIDTTTISDYKKIEEESPEHHYLSTLAEEILIKQLTTYNEYNFQCYDEYFSIIIENIQKTINIIRIQEKSKLNIIESKTKINKDKICINIVLNVLTKYLIQENEKIKNLQPSKIKQLKWYPID